MLLRSCAAAVVAVAVAVVDAVHHFGKILRFVARVLAVGMLRALHNEFVIINLPIQI